MANRRALLQFLSVRLMDAIMARAKHTDSEVLYRRTLPGGGFVAITQSKVTPRAGHPHFHGEVVVERRTDASRRDGHRAPTVAVADARTESDVLRELFPVANSNTLIATACIARRRASDRVEASP